mmetsp:Transcript_27655/g.60900  ORF Transcript_27655/g.60900 Transcript_27655/m.60900 type:complete len:89 (-) Transcript_27655:671-937(-)
MHSEQATVPRISLPHAWAVQMLGAIEAGNFSRWCTFYEYNVNNIYDSVCSTRRYLQHHSINGVDSSNHNRDRDWEYNNQIRWSHCILD